MTTTNKMKILAGIMRDDVTTASVTMRGTSQLFTFMVERSLAESLKAEDPVLVETIKGLGVGKIHEVHEENEMDPESDFEPRWIFGTVDVDHLKQLRKGNDVMAKKLRSAQRKSLRASALSALGITQDAIRSLTSSS